jgi:hypothetical protein
MQIVLGCLFLVLGIGGIVLFVHTSEAGMGIWGGALFIITGSFGVVSSRKRNRCTIITCMVLSIISSVLAWITLLMSAKLLVHVVFSSYVRFHLYRISGGIVIGGLLIVGLVELIVSIVQSALCCRVTCCGTPTQEVRVLYVPYTPGEGLQYSGQEGNVTFLGTATPNSSGHQPMIIIAPQNNQTVPQGALSATGGEAALSREKPLF